MKGSSAGRAQSGLDRLLLFVIVVVAVVFLTPHALGLAGIDVRGDVPAPSEPSDHDVTILAARGEVVDDDSGSIGAVRLVVVPNHDRVPVDLREGTAIWVDDRTRHLVPVRSHLDGVDGAYRTAAADGGPPVLESPTDRGILEFDLGTDDVAEVEEFGRRLQPGESAWVTLVTPHGETVTRPLTVPEDVPADADEVWL